MDQTMPASATLDILEMEQHFVMVNTKIHTHMLQNMYTRLQPGLCLGSLDYFRQPLLCATVHLGSWVMWFSLTFTK